MKRILTLDGGGIRGVFSLQILAAIEAALRRQTGRADLVLRDEFDFFAGTSTGAIIAAFLAWGLEVRKIESLYVEHGAEMFAPARWRDRWKSKFRADRIAEFFRSHFCEDDDARTPSELGSRKLWVGDAPKHLLIVMRNASTGSPWPVCNNPNARYNRPGESGCNLQIPLWQLLRASTAAPTYFPPETINIGGTEHLFVDGGITPYNNPSLIAALTATLPEYGIGWPATVDSLQLVSIGTGFVRTRLPHKLAREVHLMDQAAHVVPALLQSVAREQDVVCRILGDCRFGDVIDREIGDLRGNAYLAPAEKKFRYVRYDREYTEEEIDQLARDGRLQFSLDNLELIPFLQKTGADYAGKSVVAEHFAVSPSIALAPGQGHS